MAIDIVRARNVRSHCDLVRFRGCITVLGVVYLSGCSLQGFDYLSNGGAANAGDTSHSGGDATAGATDTSAGGLTNAGGTNGTATNSGGTANASTTTSAGGTTTSGTSAGGATSAGGTTGAVGTTTGGTSSTTTSTSTAVNLSGCAFTQSAGQLLVPPSTGFETDLTGWTTTAQNAAELKRVQGNGQACEGNWYMTVSGSLRQAGWDGPAFEVFQYVTVGHTYIFSVAARQTPSGSSVASIAMKLVVSESCSPAVYIDLPIDAGQTSEPVLTDWLRLTGQFAVTVPAGCGTLSSVRLYIASNETAAPYASFDVDDFRLIDLTTGGSDAGTGSGGASGTGGAAGAGAGGATSTGGASSAGGATSTGATSGIGGAGVGGTTT